MRATWKGSELTFSVTVSLDGVEPYKVSARRMLRPEQAILRYRLTGRGKVTWYGGAVIGTLTQMDGRLLRRAEDTLGSGAPEWLHETIREWWPTDLYMVPRAYLEGKRPEPSSE